MPFDVLGLFRSVGAELTAAGLVQAGTGTLSIWTPEAVIITAEGARLNGLTETDLCTIARSTVPPARHPALDAPIHRAIYVATGARAVVHAHPPHTVALSFDRTALVPLDLEGTHLLGQVPVVSARRNVVEAVAAALTDHPIVVVAGHGTYARGNDLWECLRWTAVLEASARILWLRQSLPTPPAPRGSDERT